MSIICHLLSIRSFHVIDDFTTVKTEHELRAKLLFPEYSTKTDLRTFLERV